MILQIYVKFIINTIIIIKSYNIRILKDRYNSIFLLKNNMIFAKYCHYKVIPMLDKITKLHVEILSI